MLFYSKDAQVQFDRFIRFEMFKACEGLEQFIPGIETHSEPDAKMYSIGKNVRFSVCQLPTSGFQ